ncbi:hypothetical protein [Palleronia caenipelagi]|uniref:HEPN domain-containing protein n=1 Tax=Palleronia caenipelagi TaxID=2489174 RepID=A0A547Q8G7_9RHOB|nr:hypothetical protein [Palleronia caenipelagi]TRD22678.1 hypothetical protein FEV53_04495 [Palleronia caenipelagi]
MVENHELAKRIYDSALCYISGGQLLDSRVGDYGKASVMLSIFGFELLLKCVYVLEYNDLSKDGHNYWKIWNSLPESARKTLKSNAKSRFGSYADYSDMAKVLNDLEDAFTRSRYSYELDKTKTNVEINERARAWIERGAPADDAKFRFRPNERMGLVYALARYIQERLGLEEIDVLTL